MTAGVSGQRLNAAYDRASGNWHRRVSSLGFCAAYDRLARDAITRVGAAERVLDVGCGTGALSDAWVAQGGLAAGGQLSLLDPSKAMLQQAGARLRRVAPRLIEGGVGGARDGAAYDVVLCAHVLEHLDDPMESLSWVKAQLRRGGMLVLAASKPHWCTALVRLRWGSAAWRPERVQAMLEGAGFGDVTLHPFAKGPPSRVSCGYIARAAV